MHFRLQIVFSANKLANGMSPFVRFYYDVSFSISPFNIGEAIRTTFFLALLIITFKRLGFNRNCLFA